MWSKINNVNYTSKSALLSPGLLDHQPPSVPSIHKWGKCSLSGLFEVALADEIKAILFAASSY